MLDMHFIFPTFAFLKVVQGHGLPVYRIALLKSSITNRWHLEWEKGLIRNHIGVVVFLDFLGITVCLVYSNHEVVAQKLTVESADDDDFIV